MAHFDVLALASQDPRVPADERHDLNAEVMSQLLGSLRYPDPDETVNAVDMLLGDTGYELLAKSPQLVSDRFSFGTYPSERRFGIAGEVAERRGKRVHQSVLEVNEYGIVYGYGDRSRWLEKQTSSFEFLKSTVMNVDIVKAVLLTRQRQVQPFLLKERDQRPLGYRFKRVDDEKLTDKDKPAIRRLVNFLENSGDEADPVKRERLRRGDLNEFVSKLLWDTLSADACPIEYVRTYGGKLSGYHNLPYDTIRLCTETGYEGEDEIRAVQVIDSVPYVVFGYDDLLYRTRNPRSDLYAGGYGFAEPEMVVRAMTAYLNAVTYNAAGLDRNAIPRGILTLFGEFGEAGLRSFKRQMKAMLTGAANRWTLPMMVARKGKEAGHIYTPIDTNFNEMFFAKWMTFLVSIVCAVYGIDPAEIHFDSFSASKTSSLRGDDTSEKLANSRDKGLIPLLAFVERVINQIVRLVDPTYEFEFVGIHQEDEDKRHERIKLSSTLDELREMDGKEPMKNPLLGQAPSNSAVMQVYMASTPELQQQQQAPGGEGGPGDQGGAGDDYPKTATGEHNPYGLNPDGGEQNPPPTEEHLHSVEFGKAVNKRVRRVGGFMVVVDKTFPRAA